MDFKHLNDLVMERAVEFCEEFLPGGDLIGDEWCCANLGGGAGMSCKFNTVTGLWGEYNPGGEKKGGDAISLATAVIGYRDNRQDEVKQYEGYRACKAFLGHNNHKFTIVEPPVASPPDGAPDNVWVYRDAKGNAAFGVRRWNATETADKRIQPFDPATGEPGYPRGTKTKRPLLNLPEILARPDDPVVLVGGEKCADAITRLGYLGTTNAGGESALRQTNLRPLEDRDVILWPDNDEAGEAWAEKTARALVAVGAATVRVVQVPDDVPDKWDAADAEADERIGLIAAAERSEPVARASKAESAMDVRTTTEPEPRDWIVEGALLKKKVSFLYGQGGVGKSLSVLDMAHKITTREKRGEMNVRCFWGYIPEEAQGPVVYITLEEDRDELKRRLWAIDPEGDCEHSDLFIVPALDQGLNPALVRAEGSAVAFTEFAKKGLAKILDDVEKRCGKKVILLILDPAGGFINGDENSNSIVQPLMLWAASFAAQRDMALLFVGHASKGAMSADKVEEVGSRGASAWTFNARASYGLWRPKQSERKRILAAYGIEQTGANKKRLVLGHSGKVNFEQAPASTTVFLQNPQSGVLRPITDEAQRDPTAETEDQKIDRMMLNAIRENAARGMPLNQSGANGVNNEENRIRLPKALQDCGQKKMIASVQRLIAEDRVVHVGSFGGAKRVLTNVLDVPDGPVVNNLASLEPHSNWKAEWYGDEEGNPAEPPPDASMPEGGL